MSLAKLQGNWHHLGMCAQYEVILNSEDLEKILSRKIAEPFEVNQRILPYTQAIVLVKVGDILVPKEMNYSLVPSWSKTKKVKFGTHNARIETIAVKPTWQIPFLTRRCIIPMSNFIEPIYENELAGHMVKFSESNEQILFAAGIWDQWIDKSTGEIFESFAIITRSPLAFVEQTGHDRSPIFLERESIDIWLDSSIVDENKLLDFLHAEKNQIEFKATKDRPLKDFKHSQLKLF